MTVQELYRQARRILEDAGLDSPDFDAGELSAHFFGLDRAGIALYGNRTPPSEAAGCPAAPSISAGPMGVHGPDAAGGRRGSDSQGGHRRSRGGTGSGAPGRPCPPRPGFVCRHRRCGFGPVLPASGHRGALSGALSNCPLFSEKKPGCLPAVSCPGTEGGRPAPGHHSTILPRRFGFHCLQPSLY